MTWLSNCPLCLSQWISGIVGFGQRSLFLKRPALTLETQLFEWENNKRLLNAQQETGHLHSSPSPQSPARITDVEGKNVRAGRRGVWCGMLTTRHCTAVALENSQVLLKACTRAGLSTSCHRIGSSSSGPFLLGIYTLLLSGGEMFSSTG